MVLGGGKSHPPGVTAEGTDPLSPGGTLVLPGRLSPPSLLLLPRPEPGPLVRFGDCSYTKFRQDASLDSSACREICVHLSSTLISHWSLYADKNLKQWFSKCAVCRESKVRPRRDPRHSQPSDPWPEGFSCFLENH